ncbi:MAG: GDP-mannose 4,6-dehydratase [Patescibacteria group bacterium]|nr:GDP-mannose 4,6-dehydratase [Patescibacteria group bacterium]
MPISPIFEKKNVLVTGGAGFIGSHLCESLLDEAKVICIDNFVTSSESNIDRLMQNPDFEFLRLDTNEPFDLESFPELERFKLRFQGIQEVYHLACPTSAKRFDEFKLQTALSNSVGTRHALDIAVKYKAKFLFTSSSVIYGGRKEEHLSFREDEIGGVSTISPRACYDEGKRFAEAMVATYSQVFGIDAKIARIFRTYGPRMKLFDGQMIPDFITDALDGKELVIYGDESFKTSLCFVSDIVDGLKRLMQAPADIGPVNLGSDQDFLLADVAKKIIAMVNSSSEIKHEPPLLFMTELGLPDITKAKERLDWIPLVRLEEGLQKTIDFSRVQKGLVGI